MIRHHLITALLAAAWGVLSLALRLGGRDKTGREREGDYVS